MEDKITKQSFNKQQPDNTRINFGLLTNMVLQIAVVVNIFSVSNSLFWTIFWTLVLKIFAELLTDDVKTLQERLNFDSKSLSNPYIVEILFNIFVLIII